MKEFAPWFLNATGGGGIFAGIALVLFMLIFATATFRALRQPRAEMEHAARLPLEDE